MLHYDNCFATHCFLQANEKSFLKYFVKLTPIVFYLYIKMEFRHVSASSIQYVSICVGETTSIMIFICMSSRLKDVWLCSTARFLFSLLTALHFHFHTLRSLITRIGINHVFFKKANKSWFKFFYISDQFCQGRCDLNQWI